MGVPTLQVNGINHVVLHVTDLERSRKFYTEVLGFEDRNFSTGRNRGASFLRGGSQGLDLFEVSGGDVYGGKEMNHMALSVEADDVEAVSAALEAVGIDTSEKTPRNSLFISDPDGHRIEILPRSAYALALDRDRTQVAT